jgi:hypothetical protein
MNRKPLNNDESWESDAVWKLLDQAPPAGPGPRFVDDTVRAARLLGQPSPWWKRFFSPAPLVGLAAAAAAVVLVITQLSKQAPVGDSAGGWVISQQAAEIEEIAETETLISAVDHMENFSDPELVSLIGL